jgi:hypothetical protein
MAFACPLVIWRGLDCNALALMPTSYLQDVLRVWFAWSPGSEVIGRSGRLTGKWTPAPGIR